MSSLYTVLSCCSRLGYKWVAAIQTAAKVNAKRTEWSFSCWSCPAHTNPGRSAWYRGKHLDPSLCSRRRGIFAFMMVEALEDVAEGILIRGQLLNTDDFHITKAL